MRRISWLAFACLPALAHAAPLEDTHAFDRAFATSFYTFDACGDGKYGGLFRKALDARFAQCPFSPEARAAHKRRNVMQAEKSRGRMNALIEQTGGLPVRLPGMEETCRQQKAEPDYAALRVKLERFSEGALKPDDVLASPCDADAIAP